MVLPRQTVLGPHCCQRRCRRRLDAQVRRQRQCGVVVADDGGAGDRLDGEVSAGVGHIAHLDAGVGALSGEHHPCGRCAQCKSCGSSIVQSHVGDPGGQRVSQTDPKISGLDGSGVGTGCLVPQCVASLDGEQSQHHGNQHKAGCFQCAGAFHGCFRQRGWWCAGPVPGTPPGSTKRWLRGGRGRGDNRGVVRCLLGQRVANATEVVVRGHSVAVGSGRLEREGSRSADNA